MSVAFAGIVNDPLYYGRIKLRPDIYFCTMKISHVGIYAQKLRVGSNLLFQFFWRKIEFYLVTEFYAQKYLARQLASFSACEATFMATDGETLSQLLWHNPSINNPSSLDTRFVDVQGILRRSLLKSVSISRVYFYFYLLIYIYFFIFLQKLSTSQFLYHCELSAFVACDWQTFSQNNLVTTLMRNKDAHKMHAQRNILVLFSKSYQVNNVLDIEVISRALRV